MEEERRRSQNKDLKATSIMMELVEIEHSIKIAENGPVSIREDIGKAIQIFYDFQQAYKAAHTRVFILARKLFECFNLACTKLLNVVDTLSADIRKVEEENTRLLKQRKQHIFEGYRCNRMVRMGGCSLIKHQRGIDERDQDELLPNQTEATKTVPIVNQEEEQLIVPVKQQDRTLLSIRGETITTSTLVNLIDSHINSFKAKPQDTEQSSLELNLTTILRYLTDCQRQATIFINHKALELPVVCTVNSQFTRFIEEFKTQQCIWRENALRKLNELIRKSRLESQKQTEEIQMHKSKYNYLMDYGNRYQAVEDAYRETKANFMTKHYLNQAVQTTEGKDYKGVQQFLKEQTVEVERLTAINAKLKGDIQQLRSSLQSEKNQKQKLSQAASNLRLENQNLMKTYGPIQTYITDLEKDYKQLQQKFKNIQQTNVDELVNENSNQYSTEMRISMANTLKTILHNVSESTFTHKVTRRRNNFRFRLDKVRAIPNEDFRQSFLQQLLQFKSKQQLKPIQQSLSNHQKQSSSFTNQEQSSEQGSSGGDEKPAGTEVTQRSIIFPSVHNLKGRSPSRGKIEGSKRSIKGKQKTITKGLHNQSSIDVKPQTGANSQKKISNQPILKSNKAFPSPTRNNHEISKKQDPKIKVTVAKEGLKGNLKTISTNNKQNSLQAQSQRRAKFVDTQQKASFDPETKPSQHMIESDEKQIVTVDIGINTNPKQTIQKEVQTGDFTLNQKQLATSKVLPNLSIAQTFHKKQQKPPGRLLIKKKSIEKYRKSAESLHHYLSQTQHEYTQRIQRAHMLPLPTQLKTQQSEVSRQPINDRLNQSQGLAKLIKNLTPKKSNLRKSLAESLDTAIESEAFCSEHRNPHQRKNGAHKTIKLEKIGGDFHKKRVHDDILRECLMDKFFKFMRNDQHIAVQAQNLLKETLNTRSIQIPTFTDKLQLRRFISQAYRLHSKQCGTGTCIHLSKFFEALGLHIEKINSRKALKINMKNIYKIDAQAACQNQPC